MISECTSLITLESKSKGEMSREEEMLRECTALIMLGTKSEGKTAMSVVFTSRGLLSFATPAISPSTSPASY